jgi:methionyl-tRNA formyltransferase
VRIAFLAVDDEFAGSMQSFLYARHPEWVVGSVIATQSIYRKSPIKAFWFVLRKSGFRYGAEMFKMKVVRRISGGAIKPSPTRLAKEHRVPLHFSSDINSDESLQQLRDWSPDVVIATNFSHYVGAKARGIARLGTWNLHKSYLPHFRGMAPSFYALLRGEKHAGATLHEISKGIDTGNILCQEAVEIVRNDSVYTLNQRTSEAGGRMLAEFLEHNEASRIQSYPQPSGDWPYYTYPSPADVRLFLRKGLRF